MTYEDRNPSPLGSDVTLKDTYEKLDPKKTSAMLEYEAHRERHLLRQERNGLVVMAPFLWLGAEADPRSWLGRLFKVLPYFTIGLLIAFIAAIAQGAI